MLVSSGVVAARNVSQQMDANIAQVVTGERANMLWQMRQMNFELQFRAIWLRTTLVDQLQNGSPGTQKSRVEASVQL